MKHQELELSVSGLSVTGLETLNRSFWKDDHVLRSLDLWSNLGSDKLLEDVEWKSIANDPNALVLYPSNSDCEVVCHILGVILQHNFNMYPHGNFTSESALNLFVHSKFTLAVGPPTLHYARKYGNGILDRFKKGITHAEHLSISADDDGQGTGAGVKSYEGEPCFEFSFPIFKHLVRPAYLLL